MFPIRFTVVTAALSVLLLSGIASAAPRKQTDDVIERRFATAPPMSDAALEKLYAGRTWLWGTTGGGFFSADEKAHGLFSSGRKRFTAWSDDGKTLSQAEGDWYVAGGGELCMRALWYTSESGGGDTTCFLHREKNGVIYQKRKFRGNDWYVFRHNPVRPNDEVRKLVVGDRASGEVARLKPVRR